MAEKRQKTMTQRMNTYVVHVHLRQWSYFHLRVKLKVRFGTGELAKWKEVEHQNALRHNPNRLVWLVIHSESYVTLNAKKWQVSMIIQVQP